MPKGRGVLSGVKMMTASPFGILSMAALSGKRDHAKILVVQAEEGNLTCIWIDLTVFWELLETASWINKGNGHCATNASYETSISL